ncbi:MAG: hypothetical protein CFH06_00975 [Alphaproteobacteria bacterium MarineAlpha3_Bin5]|nr:MAG: hypothetical protein CFH06_00975 [Alphaproteobacteria bacterium MarineAlpha3_Bin5]
MAIIASNYLVADKIEFLHFNDYRGQSIILFQTLNGIAQMQRLRIMFKVCEVNPLYKRK